jgi:hypothetical protein
VFAQLTFGKEYTAAIEAKQVAQQDAERAKFVVDKAIQDKKSAIIRAEGEATSAKLIGDAIQSNPAFLSLRKIEAAREIASTIAASQNRVFLNTDALLLDVTAAESNPVAAHKGCVRHPASLFAFLLEGRSLCQTPPRRWASLRFDLGFPPASPALSKGGDVFGGVLNLGARAIFHKLSERLHGRGLLC